MAGNPNRPRRRIREGRSYHRGAVAARTRKHAWRDARAGLVKIHGSLGFISPAGDASLRLVLRDKAKVKDFLGRVSPRSYWRRRGN